MSAERADAPDPETLRRLYHGEGLSLSEVAARVGRTKAGVVYWFDKYGIDRRERGQPLHEPSPLITNNGDERYRPLDGSGISVSIATLTAIAHGANPHDVFGNKTNYYVAADNGVKWDTRQSNISIREVVETYSRAEMRSWIQAFVAEFGVVPGGGDLRGWPGPAYRTYINEYGNFPAAIRDAGFEPRSGDR